MDSYNTQQLGELAEQKASIYLQAQGFRLLEQNYHCRYGEIDLIMRDQDDIVFIEVRSRSRSDYGNAAETVNHNKQKKLIKAATLFLQKKEWLYKVNSRFDVVAIQLVAGKWQLEWIKNAFSANN